MADKFDTTWSPEGKVVRDSIHADGERGRWVPFNVLSLSSKPRHFVSRASYRAFRFGGEGVMH